MNHTSCVVNECKIDLRNQLKNYFPFTFPCTWSKRKTPPTPDRSNESNAACEA